MNKINEILKRQAPPDFTKFFKTRAVKNQEVIDLLAETHSTSGSPDELQESVQREALRATLKKHQPFLSQLIRHDQSRTLLVELNDELVESLETLDGEQQLNATLRSITYLGISLQEYLSYQPQKRKGGRHE